MPILVIAFGLRSFKSAGHDWPKSSNDIPVPSGNITVEPTAADVLVPVAVAIAANVL